MNVVTIIFLVISASLYLALINYLLNYPKKVFINAKKELLQSLDNEKPKDWVEKATYANDYLWGRFQDRSLEILDGKHKYLVKMIFGTGSLIFMGWFMLSVAFVIPEDLGIKNILSYSQMLNFVLLQIPIFSGFYCWHFFRFEKYLIIGTQEKFLKDVIDFLAEKQNEAKNKFLNKSNKN